MHCTHDSPKFILIAALCGFVAGCPADDDPEPSADTGDSADASTSNADDDTTAADSSGGDPFAACNRGTLETDLESQDAAGNPAPPRWAGPGVDQATGELIDDGSTYVVSATYLTIKPEGPAMQAFGEVIGPVVPELLGNPGVVAFQLASSTECSSARTFTVWRDEESMMAFVMSDAHAMASARVSEISRGGSVVTHWTGAVVADITWETALTQLEADAGPFY